MGRARRPLSQSGQLEPPAFALAVSHDGAHCLIEVCGVLDLSSASELDAAITQADRDGYTAMIIVDLRWMTYCDPAGLGVIVAQHYALRAASGRLVVMNPPQQMQRLITLNQLEGVLDVRGPSIGVALTEKLTETPLET